MLGVNAAFLLAYNASKERPMAAKALTEAYDLNERALEGVLNTLSAKGLIASIKGPSGGYYMPRPEDVTLADVAGCFIGNDILPEAGPFKQLNKLTGAALFAGWQAMRDMYKQINFQQLCEHAQGEEMPKIEQRYLDFVI